MQYDIFTVLPFFKSYEGTITRPTFNSITKPSLVDTSEEIIATSTETEQSDLNNQETEVMNTDDYLDNENDADDFVKNKLERGRAAERYVRDLMLKEYGNCDKVEAKKGYDFIINTDTMKIHVEVKSLQTHNAPFHITINEIENAKKLADSYFLCLVVLPSLEKGVKDIRFLRNPIKNLGIEIRKEEHDSLEKQCTFVPEKFLIKLKKGHIFSLPKQITIKTINEP
jgi:hypothetical protein